MLIQTTKTKTEKVQNTTYKLNWNDIEKTYTNKN